MTKHLEFRKLKNANIDIENDVFVQKSKELLRIKNPIVVGSYNKYGFDKACDLDFNETILIKEKSDIKSILQQWCKKLANNKNEMTITVINFYFDDKRITTIIKSLGYINGLLEIKKCNLDFKIDLSLPVKVRNKISSYRMDLLNNLSLDKYIDFYVYLNKLNISNWSLTEFKKGEKTINGILIRLYDMNFSVAYVECIYQNFRITNYIEFTTSGKSYKPRYPFYFNQLYEVIESGEISYLILLKKILVFLKFIYYQKSVKTNTIKTYNDLYDFRETVGIEYNKICRISNDILIQKDKSSKKQLQNEYNKYFAVLNDKCKAKYLTIKNNYKHELKEFFRLGL